jgi:hypothetical protein
MMNRKGREREVKRRRREQRRKTCIGTREASASKEVL